MAEHTRKPVPRATELSILDKSRRRCALCFQLVGDLSEKHGQIAHLDHNPANFAEDNLAWLCLEHHSVYDSRTSQHKNYTVAEVKAARARLYKATENDEHLSGGNRAAGGIETDRALLADLVAAMTANQRTSRLMREFNFAGWSFPLSDLDPLQELADPNRGPEHEFVDQELEALRASFTITTRNFLEMIARHTFPVRDQTGWNSVPEDWEEDNPSRFHRAVKDLHESASAAAKAYDTLVRRAKQKLAP
jgi:hypothetical protein